MRVTKKLLAPALIGAVALVLAGCAPSTATGDDASIGAPVDVAIITSQTGPLAAYGEAYLDGFEAGLDYATDGTGTVDGRELDITVRSTTRATPTRPSSTAKDFIGQGYADPRGHRIVGHRPRARRAGGAEQDPLHLGSRRSRCHHRRQRLHLPFGSPDLPGRRDGRNVHRRPGRQERHWCSRRTPRSARATSRRVQAVLGGAGRYGRRACSCRRTRPSSRPSPSRCSARSRPRLRGVGGCDVGRDVAERSRQQGVFDAMPVVTGLGDIATYGAYGAASDDINFLNHYFGGAAGTDAEAAMIDAPRGGRRRARPVLARRLRARADDRAGGRAKAATRSTA